MKNMVTLFLEGKVSKAFYEDCNIQEKIDLEIRIREGIWKLLSLSTQKDQILHAVKNLMVCNARIMAYTSELQKLEEQIANQTGQCDTNFESKERTACKGKLAISDIRIPLMWKDSDHFSNKERSERYAIFCLFKMGAEVFDTDMLIVDKTITDICFENMTVLLILCGHNTKPELLSKEARPDFKIKVEVYSCCTEESSITSTPKKLAKKLKTSISKATGKKINSVLQEENHETCLFFSSTLPGVKYHLLAHTTLTLESAEDSFKTHNLSINGNEESSFWLPLYGNMCCRLVAQPACMAEDAFAGFLNQQQVIDGLTVWRRLYCVLRGGKLYCFYSPEEIEAKVEPTLVVPIHKETRIRAMEKDAKKGVHNFSVINPLAGQAVTHVFAVDSRADLQKWMEAFWQHFFDLSQWKHCCEELMKIEIMSPRKPPLFLTKEATSVYHDMSIDSPVKLESLTDIIHKKIEETNGQFLIGQDEEVSPPPWATIFDGNHKMVIQKKVLSPAGEQPHDEKRKKRRAPLPPPDRPPFSLNTQSNTDQLGKDNWGNTSTSQSLPLDTRLSTLKHHLQKPIAAPRKLLPARNNSLTDGEHTDTKTNFETKPVPAPRQKSIKDILDPRSWLQAQV
ncbi:PREDICTED: rhotekin-2 isoform X2 [Chinchilla lanigera]|uniref:rhotekin-2 isoform X2 n=1 Tax=Chinchilla lanigera TaxID=34839 RepID=UPI00069636F1|nr:PREDICTED: rhotekin-2 isoform X2 [Chinchilla lanigera]